MTATSGFKFDIDFKSNGNVWVDTGELIIADPVYASENATSVPVLTDAGVQQQTLPAVKLNTGDGSYPVYTVHQLNKDGRRHTAEAIVIMLNGEQPQWLVELLRNSN